jgi:hypothetical protein
VRKLLLLDMCKVAEAGQAVTSADARLESSGISHVPDTILSKMAYDFAFKHLPPAILNHSVRVFLFASHLATLPQPVLAVPVSTPVTGDKFRDLLFVAAMFHDIGTCSSFNGSSRFEICGADAAVNFLRTHAPETPDTELRDVWTAIACHTTSGIAQEIGLIARLIHLAVLSDFDIAGTREKLSVVMLARDLDRTLPRLDIEAVLTDAIVKQIIETEDGEKRRKKAPEYSWPRSLLTHGLEKPGKEVIA